MFSGIIYNQGKVKSIRKSPRYVEGSRVIEVSSDIRFQKNDIGEAVCCDGVCLTLIRIKRNSFLFYLSKETIKRSSFKFIKKGKKINIEKSINHGQKISGHYVQGHVDSTAVIQKISIFDKSWTIKLKLNNKKLHKLLIEKASISINGVSLTISKVGKSYFEVTIIPHTLKLTNLIKLKKNDKVNIEFDMVGKYLNNIYK